MYFPILLGTERDGRESEHVARYVLRRLGARPETTTRLFDPREWPLGNLERREWEWPEGERPARIAEFTREMGRADGFVIVAPEYNYGYPGALKNMLDAVYDEWNGKPFAMVGCGGASGGLRMMDQLRQVIGALRGVPLHASVAVPFVGEAFDEDGPADAAKWDKRFDALFDELEAWAGALATLRDAPSSATPGPAPPSPRSRT